MALERIVVAGDAVLEQIQQMRAVAVQPSRHSPGLLDSDSLTAFQRQVSNQGYVEAEIVLSAYGYSIRYASGLQNWGLIAGARNGQVDGTWEGAVAQARIWQAQDPTKRWVTSYQQPEGVTV